LIGCGSIGTVIAKAIDEGKAGELTLKVVYDIVREHAETLVNKLSTRPVIAKSSDDLIKRRDVRLVIEAASQEAVKQYAAKILKEGKDFMVMSTGALLDKELFDEITALATKYGGKVYVPSGAIVGLDNIKSAALEEIESVTLTTRKPPVSFEGAPFIKKMKIDLKSIKEPTLLYEGPARKAVKLFPRNVNVAASLSLAGIGPDRTIVKIIADPNVKEITHEIKVKGVFGELVTKTVNKPFPDNPKTSYIAALSAIATLRRISSHISIGT